MVRSWSGDVIRLHHERLRGHGVIQTETESEEKMTAGRGRGDAGGGQTAGVPDLVYESLVDALLSLAERLGPACMTRPHQAMSLDARLSWLFAGHVPRDLLVALIASAASGSRSEACQMARGRLLSDGEVPVCHPPDWAVKDDLDF